MARMGPQHRGKAALTCLGPALRTNFAFEEPPLACRVGFDDVGSLPMPRVTRRPKSPDTDSSGSEMRRVRLKPHDSFDLIRLIARSQSDARKAIGELVQNSLDANARHVEITWFNDRGARGLRIRDDGEGIFPQEGRAEALQKLAQTIGHSHKRALSPAERHRQMVLGKYGIGLLGFWCAARIMEIASRVGGGETWLLRLEEDRPEAEVFRARAQRTFEDDTLTEITLRDVHESVQRQMRPARLQAYLAGELRGQILGREVEIRIHDRVARGRATKEFLVRPRAYLGIALNDLRTLEIPGHEDARIELYYVPPDEERRGVVSLSCGGATVLDDLAMVDPTDPSGSFREPWNTGRFEGVIDFPDLQVAPGTRRGFVPDEAALDFLIALEKLERALRERLVEVERERARQRHASLAREIRRAFAPVARSLPQYDLFDVRAAGRSAPATEKRGARGEELGEQEGPAGQPEDASAVKEEALEAEIEESVLFPPGPLASLRIIPSKLRLPPSTERRLRARADDVDGRKVGERVELRWRLEGPGSLSPDGTSAIYRATDAESEATVHVEALQGKTRLEAQALIQVQAGSERRDPATGIPEPQPVNAPSEPWRSRIRGDRWEYNEGHRDYQAVCGEESRRLRYLIHLFSKEVVLRNFGSPGEEGILERMVEILTHLGDGKAK